MLFKVAMLSIMAVLSSETVRNDDHSELSAIRAFQDAFGGIDWQVAATGGGHPCDLVIEAPDGSTFLASLKSSSEGRPDRVTALFAQALLQARAIARQEHGRPAVLIWVKTASPSLIKRVQDFHAQYADGEAFGVISGDGLQYLSFPGVSHEIVDRHSQPHRRPHHGWPQSHLVFSDRTQWMLKLLLAPEIPEALLTARREQYKSAADLARAAGVSAMTASRFVKALGEKGFLDQSAPFLKLVMRRKLADLWKATYKNQPDPVPVKFMVPGPPTALMERLVREHQPSFLGLFAAAEALGAAHVRGVPPHLCVYDVETASHWDELRAARYGEKPDLLLERIRFPHSVGNGAVQRNGVYVTDILQVWLDVSAHPARGAEMASELEHGVLEKVIGAGA